MLSKKGRSAGSSFKRHVFEAEVSALYTRCMDLHLDIGWLDGSGPDLGCPRIVADVKRDALKIRKP